MVGFFTFLHDSTQTTNKGHVKGGFPPQNGHGQTVSQFLNTQLCRSTPTNSQVHMWQNRMLKVLPMHIGGNKMILLHCDMFPYAEIEKNVLGLLWPSIKYFEKGVGFVLNFTVLCSFGVYVKINSGPSAIIHINNTQNKPSRWGHQSICRMLLDLQLHFSISKSSSPF